MLDASGDMCFHSIDVGRFDRQRGARDAHDSPNSFRDTINSYSFKTSFYIPFFSSGEEILASSYSNGEITLEEDLSEESIWIKGTRYALDSLDNALMMNDILSMSLLPGIWLPPVATAQRTTAAVSLSGKLFVKMIRSLLPAATKKTCTAMKVPLRALNKYEVKNLPKNPNELLKKGYIEISHPTASQYGHRTFKNPATDQIIRFDKGKLGAPGHRGKDHYHFENLQSNGPSNAYLDRYSNPCAYGSHNSHIYPE